MLDAINILKSFPIGVICEDGAGNEELAAIYKRPAFGASLSDVSDSLLATLKVLLKMVSSLKVEYLYSLAENYTCLCFLFHLDNKLDRLHLIDRCSLISAGFCLLPGICSCDGFHGLRPRLRTDARWGPMLLPMSATLLIRVSLPYSRTGDYCVLL